ncbi:MAG: hypothetical protein JJU11_10450 [Candidatus Sumerlaeia bacterium]|nr:hypothetical protein [Candidatus Sumerlaeia bacterium]
MIRAIRNFISLLIAWVMGTLVFLYVAVMVTYLIFAIVFHPVVRVVSGGVLLLGGGTAILCWRHCNDDNWEKFDKGWLRVSLLTLFLTSAAMFSLYVLLGTAYLAIFGSDPTLDIPSLRGGRLEALLYAVGSIGQPIGVTLICLITMIVTAGILLMERASDLSYIFEDMGNDQTDPQGPILQTRPKPILGNVRRIVMIGIYTSLFVAFAPITGLLIYEWLFIVGPTMKLRIPEAISIFATMIILLVSGVKTHQWLFR